MITFHIRAPLPRMGGSNLFYRPGEVRITKTLCGAPRTDHDIRYSWQASPAGSYVPCEECVAIQKGSRMLAHELRGSRLPTQQAANCSSSEEQPGRSPGS